MTVLFNAQENALNNHLSVALLENVVFPYIYAEILPTNL